MSLSVLGAFQKALQHIVHPKHQAKQETKPTKPINKKRNKPKRNKETTKPSKKNKHIQTIPNHLQSPQAKKLFQPKPSPSCFSAPAELFLSPGRCHESRSTWPRSSPPRAWTRRGEAVSARGEKDFFEKDQRPTANRSNFLDSFRDLL